LGRILAVVLFIFAPFEFYFQNAAQILENYLSSGKVSIGREIVH